LKDLGDSEVCENVWREMVEEGIIENHANDSVLQNSAKQNLWDWGPLPGRWMFCFTAKVFDYL